MHLVLSIVATLLIAAIGWIVLLVVSVAMMLREHSALRKLVDKYYEQSPRDIRQQDIRDRRILTRFADAISDDRKSLGAVDVFVSCFRVQRERALEIKQQLEASGLTVALYNPKKKWEPTWTRIINLISSSRALVVVGQTGDEAPDYQYQNLLLSRANRWLTGLHLGWLTLILIKIPIVRKILSSEWAADRMRSSFSAEQVSKRIYHDELLVVKLPSHHSGLEVIVPKSLYVYDEISIARAVRCPLFILSDIADLSFVAESVKSLEVPDVSSLTDVRLLDVLKAISRSEARIRSLEQMYFEDFPLDFSELDPAAARFEIRSTMQSAALTIALLAAIVLTIYHVVWRD